MTICRPTLFRLLLPLLCAAWLAPAPAQAQIAFRSASSAVGPAGGTIAFRAATSAAGGNITFRAAATTGTPTSATPVFRAAASATAASGVLTLPINVPAGTLQNDVMIAAVAVRPSTATITAPAGWTLVRRTDNAGPTDSNSLAVYSRLAGASEPSNYAWTFSTSTGAAGGIQAFFNVDTTSPIDVENGAATPSGLAHTAPSITTTVNGAMIVAHFTKSGAGTWTPPVAGGGMPAFTESFDVTIGAGAAGQSLEGTRALQTTAGATGAKTATASANADAGNTHMLALRPALRIPMPAGVAPNDLLLAAIAVRPNTAAITAPAGWTLVRRTDNAAANANSLAVYRRFAGAAEPTSYVFGVSGATAYVGGMQAYSGVDTATPIDIENGVTTASALAHTAPSITTTVANAMVVTHHSMSSSATWTPPVAGGGMPAFAESIDVASLAVPNAAGVSMESARAVRAAAGATGTKAATASANADVGNAHILALRPSAQLISVARPATAVQNDIMIAAIGFAPDTAVITPPADWTLIRRIDNSAGAGTNNSLAVYRKVHTATEPASYSWTFSANVTVVGGIQAYSGVDIANPIDLENGVATPSALAHTAPSITTTVANAMVVTNHTMNGAATWTPPVAGGGMPAFTESFDVTTGGGAAGQSLEGARALRAVAGATGAKTATASANADKGNAHILALRPLPGTQFDMPTPAGTQANDVLIAAIAFTPATAVINPTVPADWTLIRRMDNIAGAGTNSSLAVYRRLAIAGEPAAHGWTFGAVPTAVAGGIQAFSGVDTTTPVDVENGQNTASALTHATPNVVTTVANTMLVTAHMYASSGTWTPPAGMAESYDRANLATPNAAGVSIEGPRVSQAAIGATGAKTATAVGNADKGNTHIVALRPAPPVVPAPGDLNAFETSTGGGAITGQIYTKLISTNFSLDVVAILAGAQHATFTNTVQVDLVTGSSGGLNCPGTPVSIAGTTQSVNLTTGRGTTGNFNVAAAFPDVRVRIRFPVVSPTVTSCSTDNFSIRPTVFTVSSTDATNTGTSGTPAIKAGANFNLAAASVAGYNGTPIVDNTAGMVVGTPTQGAIGGGFGAANPVTGTATGSGFSYSEVGNFGLAANAVFDSSFTSVDAPGVDCIVGFSNILVGGQYGCSIGSTAVPQTTGSSGFGRFTPDNFNVAYNAPAFTPGCGTFSYVGAPFTYGTAPVITVTARNSGGGTTTNYAGAYMKLTNAKLATAPYDTQAGRYSRFDAGSTPALDTSLLPSTAADPAIGVFAGGVGTLTFASGSGLGFTRSTTTPSAPFNADIALSLNVIDTDDVVFAANPAAFGTATSGGGMTFTGGNKAMRFGRLRMLNALGSEKLDLPVPLQVQYWTGTGFATNAADGCTSLAAASLVFSAYTGGITAGNMNAANIDPTPTISFTLGVGNLKLLKPSLVPPPSTGATTLTVNLTAEVPTKSYLQGNWGVPTFTANPSSRATFGLYGTQPRQFIFFRENY